MNLWNSIPTKDRIRKMQEIYNIIQDEKVIVDKLINKK
jgi:hypothetical protein